MKRLLAGALVMLAAVGLQLAMVVRLLAPSPVLALAGYAALFAGMFLALTGALGHERRR